MTKGAQKRNKNSLIMYKLDLKELIEDINLSIEAIQNKDYKDAIALLEEIRQDIEIIILID